MSSFIIRVLFVLGLGSLSASLYAQPQVTYVPENEALGLDAYVSLEGDGADISSSERERWSEIYSFVTSLVTDKTLAKLSKVSPSVMQGYHFVPAPVTPLSIRAKSNQWVVYETTLALLPAPPLVERQLKAYILGVNDQNMLLPQRIIITIEGDRRE